MRKITHFRKLQRSKKIIFNILGTTFLSLEPYHQYTLLSIVYSSNHIGEGYGTPLQYSCLENPMDGGAWWTAVHGVAKSRTRLSDFTFTFMHWRRKRQPTPVFLPGESQGSGSLVGGRLWCRTESDMTEATQQQQQQQQVMLVAPGWGSSSVIVSFPGFRLKE